MGKLNLSALRVRRQALAQKSAEKVRQRPCWFDIVSEIPPATILARNQAQQHAVVRQRKKTVPGRSKPETVIEKEQPPRSSSIFKPTEIRYEEDQLRKEFFRDHPWELARPRVVLENDGKDYERSNWTTMQQRGKRLDGESVVQRQLYLLNNVPDMTKAAAYDIARREFYHLRLQEDVERRVAQEEARATGAYFGLDTSAVGMQLEDRVYDEWLAWAEKENQIQEQKAAAFAGVSSPAAEGDKGPNEEAEEPEVTPELEAGIVEAQKPNRRPQSVFR